MYVDDSSNPVTPDRMRRLGEDLGKELDRLLAAQKLAPDLAPMVLASALLGQARKQSWGFEQIVSFLHELRGQARW